SILRAVPLFRYGADFAGIDGESFLGLAPHAIGESIEPRKAATASPLHSSRRDCRVLGFSGTRHGHLPEFPARLVINLRQIRRLTWQSRPQTMESSKGRAVTRSTKLSAASRTFCKPRESSCLLWSITAGRRKR